MSLRPIVRALGGDLYDGGRRANVPAPGHSAHDRSISLLWSEGRLLIYSFGAADWRDARDHLRRLGLTRPGPERMSSKPKAPRPAAERVGAAWRLWCEARPVAGSLGERHLRLRRISRSLGSELRFHPSAPISVYGEGPWTRPALVAAVRNATGELTAVELTYLEPGGRRASGLRLSRKTVGVVPPGAAVRLDRPAPAMLVAEGVATALSASERFARPTWALLAARNLAAWSPPPEVHDVLIASDRGSVGEAAARKLERRLRRSGIFVGIALPPAQFGDWNDAAAAEREGRTQEGAPDGTDGPPPAQEPP